MTVTPPHRPKAQKKASAKVQEPSSGNGKKAKRAGKAEVPASTGRGVLPPHITFADLQKAASSSSSSSSSPLSFDGTRWFVTRQTDSEVPTASQPNALSIHELLHPLQGLRAAFMVAGYIDPAWILSTFGPAPSSAPVTIVVHNKTRFAGDVIDETTFIQEHPFPPNADWVCIGVKTKKSLMHAKTLLFRFDAYLRVVITSANLNPQWEVSREVLWVQDFPITGTGEPRGGEFKDDYVDFLEKVTGRLGRQRLKASWPGWTSAVRGPRSLPPARAPTRRAPRRETPRPGARWDTSAWAR